MLPSNAKGVVLSHTVYLDTEFTNLASPKLLSLGLVNAVGDEHYAELDLESPEGRGALKHASDFVRNGGVLEQWGLVPDATMSRTQMGVSTANWLIGQAARAGGRVIVAYDYKADFDLLRELLQDTPQWPIVASLIEPQDVDTLTTTFESSLGADYVHQVIRAKRGLQRHHALADAHALRGACVTAMTGKRVSL